MSDQYNIVADKYDAVVAATPYRPYIEAYTLMQVLGDIQGLSILDVATGTGYYARLLRRLGAARVVGIDIAEAMVDIARMAEQQEPMDITYVVGDVADYKSEEPFDLVQAIYLLHYAPTREALDGMVQALAANLKSGGRLIAYQLNPDLSHEQGYYDRWGMMTSAPTGPDGEELSFYVSLGGITTPPVSVYRWSKETLEDALQKEGFESIRWVQPQMSPDWKDEEQIKLFEDYMKLPHAVIFEAVKR
jgi:toxoflavin synthase